MIEYASQCKVSWDIWFRDKRHTTAEFDLNFLLEKIDNIAIEWANKNDSFTHLQESIEKLFVEVIEKGISNTLDKELLLGAVFSAMVRNESQ